MEKNDLHRNCILRRLLVALLAAIFMMDGWSQPLESAVRHLFLTSNLNTDQGLSSSRAYSTVEGSDGAMWISTKLGVDRYNGVTVKSYRLPRQRRYSDVSGMVDFLASLSYGVAKSAPLYVLYVLLLQFYKSLCYVFFP